MAIGNKTTLQGNEETNKSIQADWEWKCTEPKPHYTPRERETISFI